MPTTNPIGTDLAPGIALAGDVASTANVAFNDLPLLEAAEQAKKDATLVVAGVEELAERLWAGALDADSRDDLAIDLLALAARIQVFALAVRA